jgi:hypothetical protein
MTPEDLAALHYEIDVLKIVAETIGNNATTNDETSVAIVLMALLARLERLAGKTVH